MTDFIVIGGGIAGVAAAAHLAPHGEVTLLETEPSLAYHTSGRSAAMLVENYGSAGSRPLVKAARPFLESPPEGSVDAPLLSDRAVVWVAPKGEPMERLAERAEKGRLQGSRSELLDTGGVLDVLPVMSPNWVGGGLYEPSGADIDVAALHQAFVRIARAHDAIILTQAPAVGITRKAGRWEVRSNGRTVEGDVLVNASGAWGDVIAEMAGVAPIGLRPYRRTAFMVPGSEGSAGLPMVVEVDENFYFRPDGVQYLCSLAEETPSEPTDARPRMEDVALAIERINEATTLNIRTVNSQWAGLRTFSPDRDLVIGEDPKAPGFFWLVGLGGIGMQTSPAYGALIASQVIGEDLPPGFAEAGVDPERTAPDRFR